MSLWRARRNPLTWWWTMLTLVSAVNIALWLLLYLELRSQPVDSMQLMLLLCGAYVFGCAFRSVLPRADVQRICLFDTWLSSVLVGRSVATVAEVCFVVQWSIILHQLGAVTESGTVMNVAWIIVPLILIAECFSWYAVLTTNFLYNAIENSLWAVAFFLVGMGLVRLLPEFHGAARIVLLLSITGIVAYLVFLVTVDVPMYLSRWRANHAEGNQLMSLLEGLRDVSTRWVRTHDIAHWKGEIAWMSLYFSGAVWASLALCVFYSLEGELPHYRTETAAISAPLQRAETPSVGMASVARRSETSIRATASPF
ncbi:MAG: hypothetical protein U1E61_07930 [Bradyrhizobium sp.]